MLLRCRAWTLGGVYTCMEGDGALRRGDVGFCTVVFDVYSVPLHRFSCQLSSAQRFHSLLTSFSQSTDKVSAPCCVPAAVSSRQLSAAWRAISFDVARVSCVNLLPGRASQAPTETPHSTSPLHHVSLNCPRRGLSMRGFESGTEPSDAGFESASVVVRIQPCGLISPLSYSIGCPPSRSASHD